VYQKKEVFLYYLGFKIKNTELTANQRKLEDKRINEIVANHEGKIFGIDVSQYQGTIDWENLEAIEEQFEIKFVVVRATAGSKKVDRNFKKNWKNLSSTVYIQGAYHYYRPDENSTDQANNFIKNVKLRKGHLPPILDIEKMPKGQSMDKLKKGLQNWLTIVEKQFGVKPIIYTGEKYFEDFLQEDFPNYKFWIANYNPWKEKIEDEYLMWQFTEKAQLHGINELVDVNVFNGNVDDLKNVCIK
jgi:lysozyme